MYINKDNYDDFRIHRMDTDPQRAQENIEKLRKIKRYLTDPLFASETLWTAMASGLNRFSPGKKPYRYICEPSARNPSYQGCPYKDYCLENLSKEFGVKFTTFTRYDAYLTKGVINE